MVIFRLMLVSEKLTLLCDTPGLHGVKSRWVSNLLEMVSVVLNLR